MKNGWTGGNTKRCVQKSMVEGRAHARTLFQREGTGERGVSRFSFLFTSATDKGHCGGSHCGGLTYAHAYIYIQYTYAHMFSRRDCANACAPSPSFFLSFPFSWPVRGICTHVHVHPTIEESELLTPRVTRCIFIPGNDRLSRDGYARRADGSDKKDTSPKIHFFPEINLRTFGITNVAFSRWILFFSKFSKTKDKNKKIYNQLIRRYTNWNKRKTILLRATCVACLKKV